MTKQWQITKATKHELRTTAVIAWNEEPPVSEAAAKLLAEGWEPFAVDKKEIWFRREKAAQMAQQP